MSSVAADSKVKGQLAAGVFIITAITSTLGYVLANGVAQWWFNRPDYDFLFVAQNLLSFRSMDARAFTVTAAILAAGVVFGLLLSTRVVLEKLTLFGTTRWMTAKDLVQNHFHGDPRTGWVLAKTGAPRDTKGKHIVAGEFPHCMVVAPTGAGKGVGFVIPNLLTYKGSAVVLDIKGENFAHTARVRAGWGQTVYRFGPRDYDTPTHRWNPLLRIGRMTNPAQRLAEFSKVATLFLQTTSPNAEGFLPNCRELFVACAIKAYEEDQQRRRELERHTKLRQSDPLLAAYSDAQFASLRGDRSAFLSNEEQASVNRFVIWEQTQADLSKCRLTLGRIYQLLYLGDPKESYAKYAREVRDHMAKLYFTRYANEEPRILASVRSVLTSAGMEPFANPHTAAIVSEADFDFTTFREKPQTVYFTLPYDDVPAMAPLVRLFFADLIAALQHHEPGPSEPFPVMILLDEFQRIGRLQIVVDAISLLRGYGGNLAIITQTIPNIDEVYGDTSRKALQGGAGVKLYLTPSEEDTVAEMSDSVGKTTKRIVSKSKTIGKDGLFGTNVSERTEEVPLLTKEHARQLPEDEVIIVSRGRMPIRAKRIQYFDDHELKPVYEAQDFDAPPPLPSHTITPADYLLPDVRSAAERLADAQKARDEAEQRVTGARTEASAAPVPLTEANRSDQPVGGVKPRAKSHRGRISAIEAMNGKDPAAAGDVQRSFDLTQEVQAKLASVERATATLRQKTGELAEAQQSHR